MLNSGYFQDIIFGTKRWFTTKPMRNISRTEIEAFISKSKCDDPEQIVSEDIKGAYKVYESVKGDAVAYLHKKNERLTLKDTIIANITKKYKNALEIKNNIPTRYENQFELNLQDRLEHEAVQFLFTNSKPNQDVCSTLMADSEIITGMAEMVSAHLLFKRIDKSLKDNISLLELLESPLLDGRIYQPMGTHSWLINLSWILAHLHKGSKLLICSNISEAHLFRKSAGYETQISGFAREIAVALKFEYQLKRINNHIIMEHDNPGILVNLTLLDITMPNTEFCHYYNQAKKFWESMRVTAGQVDGSYVAMYRDISEGTLQVVNESTGGYQKQELDTALTDIVRAPPAKKPKNKEEEQASHDNDKTDLSYLP